MTSLGLSGHQAKIYMAVVRLHTATAGNVAKAAGLRREDVYRSLPRLEKLGLVERTLGSPSKIRATPAENALAFLIQREKEAMDQRLTDLMVKTQTFLKSLEIEGKYLESDAEVDTFSLISDKEAIMAKIDSMLRNCLKTATIVDSRGQLSQILFEFSDVLKNAMKRDVHVQMITELPEERDPLINAWEDQVSPTASLNLDYVDDIRGHYLLTDDREALISTGIDSARGEGPRLWTNSASLISLLNSNFKELSRSSADWKTINAENSLDRCVRLASNLKPQDHAALFYESQEEKNQVLFGYFKKGLENGEQVDYFFDNIEPRRIKKEMMRSGIDVERSFKKGSFVLRPLDDFLMVGGKLRMPEDFRWRYRLYSDAVGKGFSGYRAAVDATWWLKKRLVPELVEFERAAYRFLDHPSSMLCLYDTKELSEIEEAADLVLELVKAHHTALFTTENKLTKKTR